MGISEMLFYGGLAGMSLSLLAGLSAGLLLAARKRRLRRKLIEEYGEPARD